MSANWYAGVTAAAMDWVDRWFEISAGEGDEVV